MENNFCFFSNFLHSKVIFCVRGTFIFFADKLGYKC